MLAEKVFHRPESPLNQAIVQNQGPICAVLIADGSLMGIAIAVTDLFLVPPT